MCLDFQYEVGKSFEMVESPICCITGFHFCVNLAECFNYYTFNSQNKVAEIEAYGEIDTNDNRKYCTNKIKIVRELSWEEVLKLVNIGIKNNGYANTGNENDGNGNAGSHNIGNLNTGYCNIGNRNTGNFNRGNNNTGDWNSSNFSAGAFNIDEGEEEPKIFMFNKPSNMTMHDWQMCDANYIMSHCPHNSLNWVGEYCMSNKEKKETPSYKTTGGYLKTIKPKHSPQKWWDGLHNVKKDIVMSLPNFDADIFKKITGIEVRKKGKR